ncbi:Cysteine-rich CWC [Pseudomonas cuatrocienegasensis]|uniref:Cysteine-rich CWC n=1 Tax=Pseudomonas cuatrocienegasensis TaxID=543360 RepID=A0ABY1B927_9PSED|nr:MULTISPECIES: cysteine-rich CWC family protein [Pseudomonas]OEC35678.1 helicase [Pseudomonas sp. 21C1]SEQ25065.1 Cysteine-rich CWC [Pseudomonas cuatrocienegasensis]
MTDPNLCPACGAPNRCSQAAADTPVTDCWCFAVSIDPEVLAALPEALRDQACLCPRCAQVRPAELD